MKMQPSIPYIQDIHNIPDMHVPDRWIYLGYSSCSKSADLTDEHSKDGDPGKQVQDVQHDSHLDKKTLNMRERKKKIFF